MKQFALIGNKLGHSWSQLWFNDLFTRLGLEDYHYFLHETESLDNLKKWVNDNNISGFNVTIPYKQQIIPLLDTLSPEAASIGAVNCVCVKNGRLIGHNTDAPAFNETFCNVRANLDNRTSKNDPASSAIILGTGGAAQAVGYALDKLNTEHLFVSRHPIGKSISYDEAAKLPPHYNILVNATPVGMWPKVNACPWQASLERFAIVYDLIYNPSPTLLLRKAAESGAIVTDGLAMLHRQAELSWQLWQ